MTPGLLENILHMLFHGTFGDAEPLCRFFPGSAVDDAPEDFYLPFRQAVFLAEGGDVPFRLLAFLFSLYRKDPPADFKEEIEDIPEAVKQRKDAEIERILVAIYIPKTTPYRRGNSDRLSDRTGCRLSAPLS